MYAVLGTTYGFVVDKRKTRNTLFGCGVKENQKFKVMRIR